MYLTSAVVCLTSAVMHLTYDVLHLTSAVVYLTTAVNLTSAKPRYTKVLDGSDASDIVCAIFFPALLFFLFARLYYAI